MLQLGFVSAILADKTFEDVVDFAAENGYSCVEMMCWPKGNAERRYAGVTHIDVQEMNEDQVIYLKSYLAKKKVSISALGYYPNPLDPDEERAQHCIDHLKKLIRLAPRLGVGVVNTFIGRDPQKNIEDNLSKFAEVWPEIIKEAEDHEVKIGIENCPMLFTNDEWPGGKNLAISPAIWRKMFDLIPSKNLGLNYDPSHLVWMQMDEVEPLFEFKDRIFHVHLKDVKVYQEKLDEYGILSYPLDFHSPKIPGLGDVRWRDFFSVLTSIGYKGPVCVEVEDKAFEGSEEDIRAALLTSRNYLQQFLAL
ncbi:sugar phosphate isomerase/epimerase [Rapidithrix thailandica]|uniref:Sugar phosphate isomerase/epimerase n=1 Tax=Rapidithrix thailandica TaxID=413964 RepID=A0AAW9SI48_9BACT